MKADQSHQTTVHYITRTLPASPVKLQQIRKETAKDDILALLRDTIYEGWPNSRSECPLRLCDFWNFREDLTIEDGVIFKGDRIVVPATLRPGMLKTIHQGHLGMEKCLFRAHSSVYWLEIANDITDLSASVKLARNTRTKRRSNHYYNESCHVDRGKDWALTSKTEVNSICYYLTIIASSLSRRS